MKDSVLAKKFSQHSKSQERKFNANFTEIPHTKDHALPTKNNPAIPFTQRDSGLQTLVQMGKLITWASTGEFEWTEARDNH